MKKLCLIAISAVILLTIVFVLSCSFQNNETVLKEFLQNKYDQEFEVVSSTDKSSLDGDVLFEYTVYSKRNPRVIFNAGQKKSQNNIMPFIPPIKEKTFYDDYFEKSKEYIIGEEKTEFHIDSIDDLSECSLEIYNLMKGINDKLADYGFSVNKYTPSLSLDVIITGSTHEIEFYVMDKDVIYDLLSGAF